MGVLTSTFSERLKLAMELKRIKAVELSKCTGLSQGIISNYRSGRFEASQTNLQKLAEALDVSIPWLMGYDVPIGRYDLPAVKSKTEELAEKLLLLNDAQLQAVESVIDTFLS